MGGIGMKKLAFTLAFCLLSINAFSWGKIGHMTIAEIAENNLNKKSKVEIEKLIGKIPLAGIANWADEIKSDQLYSFAGPWHYANLPIDKEYDEIDKNHDGDVISALIKYEKILRDRKQTNEEKINALKFIVHFMGDLHQPMHLGLTDDLGGNRIKVVWFNKVTNLHAIWDEDMVEYPEVSFSEYARFLSNPSKNMIIKGNTGNYFSWSEDTHAFTKILYAENYSKPLSYSYHYQYRYIVEEQIMLAGLRLAKVLNGAFK